MGGSTGAARRCRPDVHIADWVRIGRAPWPDRDVFTTAPPIPDADPTGIVVYTWDKKYRSYGLVGGP